MINKELELSVNNEKILEQLASNLNIDFISDGSNIKKMADVYSAELRSFSSNVDSALSNAFLTTMSGTYLDMFARQYGLTRKNYKSIIVGSNLETLELSVDKDTAMVLLLTETYPVFQRGDIIYSNNTFTLIAAKDININDINQSQYISVKVELKTTTQQFVIKEGNTFIVNPTNQALANIIPNFRLSIKRPIGLATLVESEDDFKMRIYEATYLASSGANSLLASIAKDVPYLNRIETENYPNGTAVKTVYPYTTELITQGFDPFLTSLIVPLVETSLLGKVIHGSSIHVSAPEPLYINIDINLKRKTNITDSVIETLKTDLNTYFSTIKTISKATLEDKLLDNIDTRRDNIKNISVVFVSPYVSEETFELDSTTSIDIPVGRFIFINNINKINEV